jgi:DNA (cytosine-5)-methyltransferase 1
MDLNKLSKAELLIKCEELGITKCKSKNKEELKKLIGQHMLTTYKQQIKYIDLFCGLGAFHTAFDSISNETMKYTCVYACDIDVNIKHIYHKNYGIHPDDDINDINIETIPDFDILCAGFPCQPFSIAGKKEGFEDKDKGNLFFSILKIIDIKHPSTIILENVKNLLTINEGTTFHTIKNELEKREYFINYKIIDSSDYDSPQSRHRLFIIGNKHKQFQFPVGKKKSYVSVSSICDPNETKYLNYDDKYRLEKCNDNTRHSKCKMLYKLIHKKTNKGGRQGERVYSIDHCGPTICASSGGPGAKTGLYYINHHIRRLNVIECIRMFGFNDNYEWKKYIKDEDMIFYLGNSIVVNVLKIILKSVESQLMT